MANGPMAASAAKSGASRRGLTGVMALPQRGGAGSTVSPAVLPAVLPVSTAFTSRT